MSIDKYTALNNVCPPFPKRIPSRNINHSFLPTAEAGTDGTEEATDAPATEDETFIGEIPAAIGLFGNEGGAGFGGGPLVAGVKLLPKIYIISYNFISSFDLTLLE